MDYLYGEVNEIEDKNETEDKDCNGWANEGISRDICRNIGSEL